MLGPGSIFLTFLIGVTTLGRPKVRVKTGERNIMNDMNKDTSCVHMLEIDENVMSTAYTTYTNGVVVTQDHEGEQGCWSFIGKCAGCGGNPRHVFKSSYI